MSKKYFTLGAFFIATAAIVYFLILPAYEGINTVRDSIAKLNAEIKQKEDLIRALSEIQKVIAKNGDKLAFVDHVIPTGPKIEELFVIYEGLAKENQIVLPGLSISEKKGTTPKVRSAPRAGAKKTSTEEAAVAVVLNQAVADVSFHSTYEGLKSFVESVEKSRRLLDITSMQLRAPQEEGELMTVVLKVTAYYK